LNAVLADEMFKSIPTKDDIRLQRGTPWSTNLLVLLQRFPLGRSELAAARKMLHPAIIAERQLKNP